VAGVGERPDPGRAGAVEDDRDLVAGLLEFLRGHERVGKRVVFLERDGGAVAIPFSALAKSGEVAVTLAGHRVQRAVLVRGRGVPAERADRR
jgi:hypothetical protein